MHMARQGKARQGKCAMQGKADARCKAMHVRNGRQLRNAWQVGNARQGRCAMQLKAYAQCKSGQMR
jgi:hypothetical protein